MANGRKHNEITEGISGKLAREWANGRKMNEIIEDISGILAREWDNGRTRRRQKQQKD